MNIKNISIFIIILTGSLFVAQACIGQSNLGTIEGTVSDTNGNPLTNVNIMIPGTNQGMVSDANGTFRIVNLIPGQLKIQFSHVGYEIEIRNVEIQANSTHRLTIQLVPRVIPMQEIIVTPGNFSISQSQTVKQQAIEKERITAIPATLDDIYRVLQIMPGITFSDDFSAHFHVRGGKQNENLILLDGIEIYDPYHLKDIGGAVGVMNMDIIDNIAIMTGGFEARYGDRLSSVVSIKNRAGSTDRLKGNFSAGGTGISLLAESPIPYGSAMVSFRKSFLKEAAEILNPTDYTISPSFYDIQSKVTITANPNNHIIYNFLYSKDESYLEKWRNDSELHSDYGNFYQGIVWQNTLSSKFYSEFIISRGENFWDNRIGDSREEKLNLIEHCLSWDANFTPSPLHDIGLGMTYKHIHYDYEIVASEISQDQQELEDVVESYFGTQTISPRAYKLAFYLQDKFRLFRKLYMNLGVRYDYYDYNNDYQISPRIGLSCRIKDKTIIRAAWGKYSQAPIYTELTNTKGSDHNPAAQQSIHYILGVEHYLTEHLNLRVEAYIKTLDQMIGHYFEFDDQSPLPELKYGNPNSGSSKGIELFFNGKFSDKLAVWAAYAYSRTEIEAYFIDWGKLQVVKKTIPRFTDQPHNLSLFLNYKLPKAWDINIKWRYLSGIPRTPMYAEFRSGEPYWDYGDPYSTRYPVYHRLDLRIGKNFTFKNFQLTTFLEIKNLYNNKNVLLYDYRIENNKHVRNAYYTLPFLPTIEFKISF